MFVVENLPRAGTPLTYRFGSNEKTHRAVIDTGFVFTNCGLHRTPNPNVDTFGTKVNNIPPYAQCRKCWR